MHCGFELGHEIMDVNNDPNDPNDLMVFRMFSTCF